MQRQPGPQRAQRGGDLDVTPPRGLRLTAAAVLTAVLAAGVPVVAAGATEPADEAPGGTPAAADAPTAETAPAPVAGPGLAEPAGAFMAGPNGSWWVLTGSGLLVYSPTPEGPSEAYVLVAADPSGTGYWLALDTALAGVGPAAHRLGDAPAGSGGDDPVATTDAPDTTTTTAMARAASPPTTTTVAPPPSTTTTAAPASGPGGSTTYLGEFEVTCYSLHGSTSTGEQTHEGGVAVDPRVIPYGTRIHIEGVGWRTANDTGSKIQGNRLDIWHPSTDYCRDFGRRVLDVHR